MIVGRLGRPTAVTTMTEPPVRRTPLARIAGSRFLATKPMPFLDPQLSPRRRLRSLAWFASGGWRSAIFRLVARLAVGAADTVLTQRASAKLKPTEPTDSPAKAA